MNDEYDLIIIGWGAAGFAAAIRASEVTSGQARIALIGDGPIGGTCVNFGCVPSKYLIEAAAEAYPRPRHKGVYASKPSINFKELMDGLREAVKKEREEKYERVISKYENVEVIRGRASFVSEREVVVNGKRISGYNFLIATGSSPVLPQVPGLAKVITVNDLWKMDELPSSLVVVGAGATGLEVGQAMARLGSEVHIVDIRTFAPQNAEPELSSILLDYLRSEGIMIHLGVRVVRADGQKLVLAGNGEELRVSADVVLAAAGRAPNVSGLNLEAAGVNYSSKGIFVSRTMQTSNPRIYAAGDVVAQRFMLETLAAREGVTAVLNMYEHLGLEVNELEFPRAIFTYPQLAAVGILESECENCSSRLLPLESVPRSRVSGDASGAFKLVVDGRGRVVGAHVIAPNASEIIIEGALAVRRRLKLSDIVDQPHVFPTFSEGLKLTAQSFVRDVSSMPCCME